MNHSSKIELVGSYGKADFSFFSVKGNTKFWYWVMNLVQNNILEAYAILQYSVIVVAVEIEYKVMKL